MSEVAPGWSIRAVRSLRGYSVEWAEPGRLLISRRNRLFETSIAETPSMETGVRGEGAKPRRVADFPTKGWRGVAARIRLAQRLLRFQYYNALPLPDGRIFVTFDKSIGIVEEGRIRPIEGLARGCRVFRGACALKDDGAVYFGEYVLNDDRSTFIRIYRLGAGETRLEEVRRFEVGFVRHVHGIYFDPFDRSLWCVAGDVGDECRVMRSGDGFRTFETVGVGDESWRCVSLAFRREAIYYGTDAEFVRNRLYRIDRASGRRDCLAELDGPVFYNARIGEGLVFGVDAELCPSQIGRSASLWHVDGRDGVTRVAWFEKDIWPGKYFLYGAAHFGAGPGLADRLVFCTVALRGADNQVFELRKID